MAQADVRYFHFQRAAVGLHASGFAQILGGAAGKKLTRCPIAYLRGLLTVKTVEKSRQKETHIFGISAAHLAN